MLSDDLALPPRLALVLGWCERSPRRAVAAARRLVGDAPGPQALLALGWALLSHERFEAARGQLERALPGLDGPAQALLCRYGLIAIEQQTLARPGLDRALAALAEECDDAGVAALAPWVRLDQARQLNVLGRPREAAELLERLAPALDPRGPLAAGRRLRALAVSSYVMGEHQRASALLDQAEAHFRPARFLLDRARCWFERAALALIQERLDDAFSCYGAAGRVAGRAGLPLRSALCLRGSGLVAIRQGRYDLALRQTRAAADLFTRVGRAPDAAICDVHLGNIQLHTGRLAAALAAYTGAEQRFVALGLLGDRSVARRNRAMVLRAQGRAAEAWDLLEQVADEATAIGLGGELAEIHSLQAAILADAGRLEQADARYDLAHAEFTRLGNAAAAAECRLEQGWLALARGDPAAAEALLGQLHAALADRPHHRWRALYGLGRGAEGLGRPATALAHYAEACAVVAGLRRRLASEAASSGIFAQAVALYADALRLAAALDDPAALLALIEGQRALTLWRLLAGPTPEPDLAREDPSGPRLRVAALLAADDPAGPELDRALEAYGVQVLGQRHEALPDLDPLFAGEELDLARVRAVLGDAFGDDWTVVAYSFDEGRLRRVILGADRLAADAVADGPALRRLIAQASLPAYRHYTYADVPLAQGLTVTPWERLARLAGALLPPALAGRLHPGHRLLIVPAGPLHALPWAALRLGEAWLAERVVVHLLPSLSVAPPLAGRAPRGEAGLLVGCGSFRGRAPDLPDVAGELEAVAARWPGPAHTLRDEAATGAALLAAGGAGGPALLHVASHARLLPARGLAAHLKLWDGDLLLPEVAAMALPGALVVLSTCDGAAAEVLPGEEVLSLSWGFLAGGARAVVASLWPAGDRQSVAVMAALYDELSARRDPALALALAQRRLLASADANLAAAQLWGSFVTVGGIGRR